MSIEVIGDDLTELNKESGGHRIQRVPPTERKGRVHTSTVTVAVIDPQTVIEVTFNDRDFKIEWYSGTGCGGQNRNKVMSSCRLTHLPTGIVATAQTRSRENSLKEAKETLLARLQDAANTQAHNETACARKAQIGSGMRADKRRTYRFQDDTVKDDVTGISTSASKVMQGNFHLLW
jgi:peptide chain release factor 1